MINKVILIGNVGADPEIRTLESGVKVARVRLATTERLYNRQTQEAKEHTEWHSVTLWRNLADVADRFVRKGSRIYIEGAIRSNEWTDANGVKRYGIEILANDLKLLDRRGDNPAGGGQGGGYSAGGASGGSYSGGSTPGGYSTPAPAQTPQPSYGGGTPAVPADDIDDLPF